MGTFGRLRAVGFNEIKADVRIRPDPISTDERAGEPTR